VAEQLDGVLVVDEAYVDFVDPEAKHDATALVRQFDNVVLLRSLSKGYSLAGLRFGYGIGSPDLIEPMTTKTKDSYPTDAVAQALACAALEHRDDAAKTWQLVRDERARMTEELRNGAGRSRPAAPTSSSPPCRTSLAEERRRHTKRSSNATSSSVTST
jgi:histidinol-phosphate aminotransferase